MVMVMPAADSKEIHNSILVLRFVVILNGVKNPVFFRDNLITE
jgi:hypothetical protein